MVLAGAGGGLLDVVMNTRLSMIEARHNTSLMNLNYAGFSFAYAAAAMATGIARGVGISPALVFFILFLMVLALAKGMIQADFEHIGKKDATAKTQLPRAVFWGGAIILIAFLCEQAVEGWSALHIERTLDGQAGQGAIGPAILGLTMGVGRLAGQFVTARAAPARVLIGGAALSAAGAMLAALAQVPIMAYLGFGILGLGVSVIVPMAFALVGERVSDRDRAHAISRAALVGYVGFFIGPPVLGFVSQATSLRVAFILVAALMLSAPFLTMKLLRTARR